jgi:hypothetical protein
MARHAYTVGTRFDVTPSAIARRQLDIKIARIIDDLVNNNICFYTDTDGTPNDNYRRTVEVLLQHLT